MGCVWGAGGGGRWSKDFYLHQTVQTGFRDRRLLGSLCRREKSAASPEIYNSPPSSEEVKNVWGCISILQDCVFKSLIVEIFVLFFLGNYRNFRGISTNLVVLGVFYIQDFFNFGLYPTLKQCQVMLYLF